MRGFLFFASYHLLGANRREAAPLDALRQTRYSLVGIAVLDAIPDAVLDVAFQHHLPALVQGRFGRVDLGEDVLTGHILVDHPVNGLHLPNDLLQPTMQVVGMACPVLPGGPVAFL